VVNGQISFEKVRSGGYCLRYKSFQSNRSGNADIYTMNIDGSDVQQLTKDSSNESYPTWQTGGKKIIYTSNRDGNEELYQMNADGTQQQRLTHTLGSELDPSYSPDGKKVVYFYEKGDHHDQVYVANADGTNAINICNDTLNNIYPSWVGDKIIYASANVNDNESIFLSDTKGNRKEIVHHSFYARISPNGKKLAFITGDWNDGSIYISNTDGSDKKLLVKKEDIIKL
jgi:TolB protein